MESKLLKESKNMNEKVLLILVDGMRPDALVSCGHPYVQTLLEESSYDLHASTVYPSVTLPCHMSLFHSVTPDRHGILTNTYTPQVRPVNGLCEQLQAADKTCAFFYNWEQLRDLSRPASLAHSYFVSGHLHTYEKANEMVTEAAISYLRAEMPDFAFVYLGLTDEVGHEFGWMGERYMASIVQSMDEIQRLNEEFSKDYTIIVTADHGGHDRSHGSTEPEDMTIPVILKGKAFTPGKQLASVNICDIAPTVTALLGASCAREWEGKSLL